MRVVISFGPGAFLERLEKSVKGGQREKTKRGEQKTWGVRRRAKRKEGLSEVGDG